MFRNLKKNVAKLVALSLLFQPYLMLAAADQVPPAIPPVVAPAEEPISAKLNSPLKKDFTLLSQFSTTPILNNDKISLLNGFIPVSINTKLLDLMRNRMVISWNDLAAGTYFTPQEFAQKHARIKLFASLQFSNRDGLNSIVKSIGKTITRAGQAAFLNLVAQDHANWDVTLQRQNFVRFLVENPEVLKQIQAELHVIKDHEEALCKSIPLAPNPYEAMSKQKKMMAIVGLELFLFYACYIKNPKNYNYLKSFAAWNAYFMAMQGVSELMQTEAAGNLGAFLLNGLWVAALGATGAAGLATLSNYNGYGLKTLQLLDSSKADYTLLDRFILPSACAALGYGIYQLLKMTNEANKTAFYEAKEIAQLVRSVDTLRQKLQTTSDSFVNETYGADFTKQLSANWKKLVTKAKNGAFDKNSEHALFSTSQPRVLNLMSLLGQTVGDFSKTTQFYGEIDAYASMAQLYLDTQETVNHAGEPVRCCFVDLLQDSEESILRAKGVWHPILPQNMVRTNSISLGGSAETPRNAIITGPNAAGKSVSLKALLVNIILGQTFGMACAESFAFTPYAKIIARFTSADDTAAGQSKFMLEATDVVGTLKELESLQPGEKAFVVTDELFSGTEVKPAILLSSELCAEIANMKNVNYLLATHYKDLTKLKEITKNGFENYKVTAFVDDNSTVTYPFKLSPGVGDVNVAFDIFLDQMRKQGLAHARLEEIIKNARERKIATQD